MNSKQEGCLSVLTKSFVKQAQYAQITKDEALNACSLVLKDSQQQLLFNSLLQNQILVSLSKNIYFIHDISTQGILIDLTTCYSSLCHDTTLIGCCYSPCCPKKRSNRLSLHETKDLSPKEKKRQLAIQELQNYEDNFLKQLIVIENVFAKPLLSSTTTITEETRRLSFHNALFGNYLVLASHHKRILNDLKATKEDGLFPNSTQIGQLLLKHFKRLLDPYIQYVSNHVFAEYQYKFECHHNVQFIQFIQKQESIEKDFRLTLKGLLLSPIVRMAKYDLLFTTILNNSSKEDCHSLLELKSITFDILYKINEATRNAEIEARWMEIKAGLRHSCSKSCQQLLTDDTTLIFEGSLELINRLSPTTCQVFLFSNSLFITRQKDGNKYTLLYKPIPLHMLRLIPSISCRHGSLTLISSTTHRVATTLLASIRHSISLGSYHINSDSSIGLRHRIKQGIEKKKATVSLYKSPSPSRIMMMKPTRRLLQLYHIADPTLTFIFACPSTENRTMWKNKIKSSLPKHGPFGLENISSTFNYSTLHSVNGRYATGCGTIWCSLPFTTSDGHHVIALGTQFGLWVAYTDGTELFKQILPNTCHQLELFDNRYIIARILKPNRALGVILIDDMYSPTTITTTATFQPIQKSGVISFAVGTLFGEPIVCYLRRRTGSVRLAILFYHTDQFRKFKEYKPISIQPTDLKIIQDAVYITSPTEGIEKVDVVNWVSTHISLPHVPMQLDDPSSTTLGYVALNQPGTGLIFSAEAAWPVAEPNADLLQQEIKFETEATSVVVCYPYLIIFSTHVIEVRHLETTALVQAIAGNKIKCVHVSPSTIPIIHVTMLHAEQDQTKVYQLYLKEPAPCTRVEQEI